MLATYAASRHRQIVPCCMISSVSHDNVSRLVTDRSMCFATALDKAFENIDCMSAILRCQAKNRFYESTQRLIQPRRVLWVAPIATNASNANEWALFDLQFDPALYLDASDADLRDAIDGTIKVIRRVSINAQPGLLQLDHAPDD